MSILSAHSGHVRISDAVSVHDNHPVSVDVGRTIINNTLYNVESSGQVRFCWVARTNADAKLVDAVTETADRFYPMLRATIAASLRHDGTPFRFRVRIAALSSNSDACYFRIAIGTQDHIRTSINATAPGSSEQPHPWCVEKSTTSPTAAWLTSSPDDAKLITVDPADTYLTPQDTRFSISSTSPTSVQMCKLSLEVWSAVEDTGSKSHLLGLVVQEFYGID